MSDVIENKVIERYGGEVLQLVLKFHLSYLDYMKLNEAIIDVVRKITNFTITEYENHASSKLDS